MHVDKLMPYYPDVGEELHSWIETDYPTRYRDQGEQTVGPALQSQLTAVVDIPPQPLLILNPCSKLQIHQTQR